MKRAGLALCLLVFGCADDFVKAVDLGGRDFSPGDRPMDLSLSDGDTLADLATPDLASPPDFATPFDFSTLTCDLMPATTDAAAPGSLVLAAVGAGQLLHTARFLPAGGWTGYTTDPSVQISDVSAATSGPSSRPMVVVRQTDANLAATLFEPCLDRFLPLSGLSASSSHRVALAGGLLPDVVFKGFVANDQRQYHTRFDGAGWSAPAVQSTFLSNLAPAAVRESSTVQAIFTGTDTNIYVGAVGGAAAAIAGATSDHTPAAITTSDGTLHVVFRGKDTNLYAARRPAAGAFGAPASLCEGVSGCVATSNHAPVLGRDAAGAPIVAFRGTNDSVYTMTLAGALWTAPAKASVGAETTAYGAALAAGIGSATAELVYVRAGDNYAVHVRQIAAAWGTPSTLSGSALKAAPALVSLP